MFILCSTEEYKMNLSLEIIIKDDGSVEIVENMSVSNKKPVNNRTFKGKSCTVALSDYTIIDIETTGLDTHFDEIIEVSAIKIRNNQKQDIFQSLVKPKQEINDFISNLTGITNQMLVSAPSIESILPAFLDFLENDIVIGHNVNFDINFIYDYSLNITEKPFTNDFVDTMRLTRKLFPYLPNHKLKTLAKKLNLTTLPSHRAMTDCESTLELYQLVVKHAESNGLNLIELFKTPSYKKAHSITTDKTTFNEEHPFHGKNCTFTGALERMQRKDAMQIVVDLGGHCNDSIVKKTNYLILGNLDYCKTIKDGQSSKLKKAQSLILDGCDLEIISENTFYSLISSNL